MSGGTSCLSITNTIIGVIFAIASVGGIGASLYLVFVEQPFDPSYFQGTYEPIWEDIGKIYIFSYLFTFYGYY